MGAVGDDRVGVGTSVNHVVGIWLLECIRRGNSNINRYQYMLVGAWMGEEMVRMIRELERNTNRYRTVHGTADSHRLLIPISTEFGLVR